MGNQYKGVQVRGDTVRVYFQFNGARVFETLPDCDAKDPRQLAEAAQLRADVVGAIKQGAFVYEEVFPDSKAVTRSRRPQSKAEYDERTLFQYWVKRHYVEKAEELSSEGRIAARNLLINVITPHLGDIAIGELCHDDFDRLFAKYAKHSQQYRKQIFSNLRTCLNEALLAGIIHANPAQDYRLNKRNTSRRMYGRERVQQRTNEENVTAYTVEQMNAILAAAEEEKDPQIRNLIQFLLWTGMRPSEMRALTWDDIDFKAGKIVVDKALTDHAQFPEETKTESGNRVVKMQPGAREALKAQQALTRFMAPCPLTDKDGNREEFRFIFRKRDGYPVSYSSFRRWHWVRVCDRAGVDRLNPYHLRHTYASRALTSGETVAWLSKQLGHKNYKITVDVYAVYISSEAPDAGNRMVALYG